MPVDKSATGVDNQATSEGRGEGITETHSGYHTMHMDSAGGWIEIAGSRHELSSYSFRCLCHHDDDGKCLHGD